MLAKQWDIYDRNPVQDVPRLKFNNARTRYLTAEEAKVLLMACDCSSNKQLKPIVSLLLLTGARKSELLNAEWRHIDLEKRSWHLPMTKNGKSRHVPLAKAAVDIIRQLPKYDGCPYLLANPRTKLPYVDIKKAFQKARKLAGLEDICPIHFGILQQVGTWPMVWIFTPLERFLAIPRSLPRLVTATSPMTVFCRRSMRVRPCLM